MRSGVWAGIAVAAAIAAVLAAGSLQRSGWWHRLHARGGAAPVIAGAPTLDIAMTDFAFGPAWVMVKAGERINLRFVNQGKVVHEVRMRAQAIHLVAGADQSVTTGFTADRPSEYEFFCGIPGHREAGMTGRIVVTP